MFFSLYKYFDGFILFSPLCGSQTSFCPAVNLCDLGSYSPVITSLQVRMEWLLFLLLLGSHFSVSSTKMGKPELVAEIVYYGEHILTISANFTRHGRALESVPDSGCIKCDAGGKGDLLN